MGTAPVCGGKRVSVYVSDVCACTCVLYMCVNTKGMCEYVCECV